MKLRESVKQAANVVKSGGVLVYPTETICGLGCDATNSDAVKRIYEIKQRSQGKSLLSLFSSAQMIERYFDDVPEVAWELMELATTPTTIILDNPKGLAPNMIGKDNTAAIRWVKSGSVHALIKYLNVPLVSTSVNLSGEPPVISTRNIPGVIKDQIDFVLDEEDGEIGTGIPSSIIRIKPGGEFEIIRK